VFLEGFHSYIFIYIALGAILDSCLSSSLEACAQMSDLLGSGSVRSESTSIPRRMARRS
jgi:hypothetical protein